ncbi:MAG: chain length determinant protein EpsF [Pseudomonadota bacterium]
MTFDQFFRIIRARYLLVAAIAMLVITATLITSLILPKTYTATAAVMVEVKPDPVAAISSAMLPGQYLATQVDIIKSALVSQRVVRTARIGENPDMRHRWETETGQKGDYNAWLAALLQKGLDVRPSRESSVIEISYEGADPAFSATMANAFAQAYMDSAVQIRVDPARQYAEFFEERARLARQKLEAALTRLSEAQKSKGIVATDERLDFETARLNDIASQITSLRAIKAESDSRNVQAKHNAERVQDVVVSPLISTLKSQLALQEARQNETSAKYGDNHPLIIEGRANIENLRERIKIETSKIAAGVNTSDTINASRETQATAAFEEQRARVMKLKGERGELQLLEREVDSAQRIFDTIQMRLSQMNLESNSNQSSIYLINAATEPVKHTSPKLILNMLLSVILGTFLAVMVALGLETMDRRVRGPSDIPQFLELPVIGIMPSPGRAAGSLLNSGTSTRGAGLLMPAISNNNAPDSM